MRFLKRFFVLGLILPSVVLGAVFFGSFEAQAAVDASAGDLQSSASLLKPDGSSLGTLDGFSSFYFRSQTSVTSGLMTRYQSLLVSDPWVSKGLPELQILLISYADQDGADAAFDSYLSSSRFNEDDLTLKSSSSHAFFYVREKEGKSIDFFNSVSTDHTSYHWLEKNGNVLIQTSLYLDDDTAHSDTLEAFNKISSGTFSEILSAAANSSKISLGVLFPPKNALFTANTESSSLQVDPLYSLPANGTLSFDLYVSDPSGASGTVLDSSGILAATDGDLYVYITKSGKLQVGLYAPDYESGCTKNAGWYTVDSAGTLYPYEWNHIVLRFGVGGFGLGLNGAAESYCAVSQAKSINPLYLGDYPSDSLSEGMLGSVNDFLTTYSYTEDGEVVDTVLKNRAFLDIAADDPDLAIFQVLKDKKVFIGNDGYLNPEQGLTRAAMVKVILETFDFGTSTANVSFSDVSSNAWYKKYLAKAVELGMIKGRTDGTFGGGDLVTRSEFFAMLERLDTNFDASLSVVSFGDVDEEDWYYDAAAYAYIQGFVTGDYFYPNQLVTRRDAARALYQLLQ